MRRNNFRRGLLAGLVLAWAMAAHAACPRIVSQSPYITHQLDWLGLKHCIVGASRYEHTVKVADTGGVLDPDAAGLAAVKPDLVITSVWTPAEALAAATPPGARALRLASFQRMTQIEENLRQIGQAAGVQDSAARAATFAHLWRKKAASIKGGGRRVVLLSSCTGQPYSFGKNTWLAELFTAAGFVVADTTEGVRHLPRAETAQAAAALIAEMKPEVVFIFSRQIAESCATVPLPPGTPLVALDGDKFLHPAPVLLDGLEQLAARHQDWAR
jgi:iron complex transport system substrate-binding protein